MEPIEAVCLCQEYDLKAMYGAAFEEFSPWITLLRPEEIAASNRIRHALVFRPAADAFEPYPNLQLLCSIEAGVDGLLVHPGLRPEMQVVRMVNPGQANMMAGFAIYHVVG